VQLTAEERTQKYREMQMEVYNQYLKKFEEEEILVSNEPSIMERQKDTEKREKEEMKKLEKIFKKE